MAPITVRVRTNLTMLRVPVDDTATVRNLKVEVWAALPVLLFGLMSRLLKIIVCII